MTEYKPIFRSPMTISVPAAPYSTSDLTLSDLTGVRVILVQGEAGNILKNHLSAIPDNPGHLVNVDESLLARLTAKEFYLFGRLPDAKLPSISKLEKDFVEAGCFAHATDLTHGRAVLKLRGSMAAETLSKICGLDFHDTVFSNMQVKQTSVAKIKTLIARCDEQGTPAYHLHINRPLGQYLWEIVWDAGQVAGLTPRQRPGNWSIQKPFRS